MRRIVITSLLLLLALNTSWFVVYSAYLGWQGVTTADKAQVSRVFAGAAPVASFMLAVHMVAGAVLTIGAPLQALPMLRRRWPAVHRGSGRVLVVLSLITAVGGLIYIAMQGTVGGTWMSFWFAVYGIAIGVAGWQTYVHARARDFRRHFAWATRLVILAVGSWIYRMHYGVWYAVTGGTASNPEFTGLFDRVTVVAFFVPYLLVAELLLRRGK